MTATLPEPFDAIRYQFENLYEKARGRPNPAKGNRIYADAEASRLLLQYFAERLRGRLDGEFELSSDERMALALALNNLATKCSDGASARTVATAFLAADARPLATAGHGTNLTNEKIEEIRGIYNEVCAEMRESKISETKAIQRIAGRRNVSAPTVRRAFKDWESWNPRS